MRHHDGSLGKGGGFSNRWPHHKGRQALLHLSHHIIENEEIINMGNLLEML